jgi:diamine N-acetyltransferase
MYGVDPETDKHWIIELMIDQGQQQKGYGRVAMHALIDHMKQFYHCQEIYLSIVPGNTVAQKLYESLGFQDTHTVEHGENVFELTFDV